MKIKQTSGKTVERTSGRRIVAAVFRIVFGDLKRIEKKLTRLAEQQHGRRTRDLEDRRSRFGGRRRLLDRGPEGRGLGAVVADRGRGRVRRVGT